MLSNKHAREISQDVVQASPLDLENETNIRYFKAKLNEVIESLLMIKHDTSDLILAAKDQLARLNNELTMLQALEQARTLAYNIEVAQAEREQA